MIVDALEVQNTMPKKSPPKKRPQLVSRPSVTPVNPVVALTPAERSTLAVCFSQEKPGESYAQRKIRRECVDSLRLGPEHTNFEPIKDGEKIIGHSVSVGKRDADGSFKSVRSNDSRLHFVSKAVATYLLEMLGRNGHKVNSEGIVLDVEEKLVAVLAGTYEAPEVPMAGVGEEYGE